MCKVSRLFFSVALAWPLFTTATLSRPQTANVEFPRVPEAAILSLTGSHYPKITRALSTVGFHVSEINGEEFQSFLSGSSTLLIIPENEGRHLETRQLQAVLYAVGRGTPLLLDGATPLAEALGMKATGARGDLTHYHWDHYAADAVRLPGRLTYSKFKVSRGLKILAFGSSESDPLVVSGSRGHGKFVYSTIQLEPQQGMVFQYLPFLAQAIVDELNIAPSLAADNLCVYADFGGEPKADPVAVAAQLKSWSVREVHLGAFYGSDMFREFAPRFIAAAHQQGIAVYAWLEYPMVSMEFWDQHPHWREVTANGRAAIMDWRYHMALEDPDCFKAVAELTRRMVLDFDWDGVDFAELYFEAEQKIFQKPGDFTPMHPTFRRMFRQRYGVDPREMFDPSSPDYGPRNAQLRSDLKEFRVELITNLTEQFLKILADCRAQKPYLQTTLTFIDALRDPTVTERYGIDTDRLLGLEKQYDFAVEIEDPYTVWNSTPDRYRAMGEYYRPRLRPGTPLSLDVNVVDRDPPGRPLNKPRGLELYELAANVAENVDLITLYAFSTFSADDMRLLPFVLGAHEMVGEPGEDGKIVARHQLIWKTPARGQTVYVDGREWPCRSDSEVVIPEGEHTISMRPGTASSTGSAMNIEGINGGILQAERSGDGLRFTYQSRGRCYVTLSRRPSIVRCDGAPAGTAPLNNGNYVCLELPQGKHTVDVD